MKTEVTPEQVAEYQERGVSTPWSLPGALSLACRLSRAHGGARWPQFVAIHDFLDAEELEQWRALPFFRARSSIATVYRRAG